VARLGRDNGVDHPVGHGLLGGHEEVPIAVLLDLIDGLARVFADVAVEQGANKEDLFGLCRCAGRRSDGGRKQCGSAIARGRATERGRKPQATGAVSKQGLSMGTPLVPSTVLSFSPPPYSTISPHLDLNVGGLPLGPPQGLMDHDAGVGQRPPLPLGPCAQ